jgi:hypothetical protein
VCREYRNEVSIAAGPLSDETRRDLIACSKTFSDRWKTEKTRQSCQNSTRACRDHREHQARPRIDRKNGVLHTLQIDRRNEENEMLKAAGGPSVLKTPETKSEYAAPAQSDRQASPAGR